MTESKKTVRSLIISHDTSTIIAKIIEYYGDEGLDDLYESAINRLRVLPFTRSNIICTVQIVDDEDSFPSPEVKGLKEGEVRPTINLDNVPWSEILDMKIAADPTLTDLDIIAHIVWDRMYNGFSV